MVQPVSSRDAELKFLPLGNLEVLEQRQIAIKIGWVANVGPNVGSLGPVGRHLEAVGVEILARRMVARVAYELRQEQAAARTAVSVCSQPGGFVSTGRTQTVGQQYAVVWEIRCAQAWNRQSSIRGIHTSIGGARLVRGSTLVCCVSGQLPAVHRPLNRAVAVNELGQLPDCRKIQDLRVVVGQRTVIVLEVVGITGGAVARSVVALTIANTQDLPKSVIGEESYGARLFLPRDL